MAGVASLAAGTAVIVACVAGDEAVAAVTVAVVGVLVPGVAF